MSNQILKNTNARLLDEFNASIGFDWRLYPYDIAGSIAHSKMLANQNIISNDEQKKIEIGLNKIKQMCDDGKFEWKLEHEDLHMAIESKLTELIGEPAKKLHTARSRNDQVATDFRLYIIDKNHLIMQKIIHLIKTFVAIADEHTDTILPGMTHLQHAQPINFAFHLMAYVAMFKRDFERFENSASRNNLSPLGSAALAGTPHLIDRHLSASLLGFDAPTLNAMDTVSDRDSALELLFNISTTMMHISRISEELILWSSYEFKFVTISDDFATTSSIMPQKKNPDVPELLRGKTGRVYGNLIGLLTVMKGLPLAYNKDTQEDKEGVFDSVDTIVMSLDILTEMFSKITINKDKMLNASKVGHLTATDFADYLVQKNNMAFREAYYLTKKVVAKANELNKDISQLNINEIRTSDEALQNIDEDVLSCLALANSMNSRNSYGGTSTKRTIEQLEIIKSWLEKNI